jgi:hypothetical protein
LPPIGQACHLPAEPDQGPREGSLCQIPERARSARGAPESSDSTYAQLLEALGGFFRDPFGDSGGESRLVALAAMHSFDDINRSLVRAGLLPPFQMPLA